MTTRSGWLGLTKVYQSVMSAVRSSAVIGASRWLAAKLAGTSISSAMAKASMEFSFFIDVASYRSKDLVNVAIANCSAQARRHARAVTLASSIHTYARLRASDLVWIVFC